MSLLKQIVGGPKKRYKLDGYNLDLTYITDRIIAMAFPASGIEKLYRNSVDTVCQFLQKNHKDKYMTINLSGRPVDEQKLKNVKCYEWQDHKTPTFDTLFTICNTVANFLNQDDQRVAVFHCNHGKGRTGTIICCFFLFLQTFKTPAQAIAYYGEKRFEKQGYGVTQPGQLQYIQYFSQTINHLYYPKVVTIKALIFKGTDIFTSPYVKLKHVDSGQAFFNSKQKKFSVLEVQKKGEITLRINQHNYFAGDIIIDIKNQSVLSSKLYGSFAFNTAFIQPQKLHKVSLKEISPLSAQKSGNFPQDFSLQIQFKNICECPRQAQFEKRCPKCRKQLTFEEQRWKTIRKCLQNRKKLLPNKDMIVFGGKKQFSLLD